MTTFTEWLVQHRACDEGREWAGDRDLRAVWQECPRSDWLLWLLEELEYCDKRELRLYACWCVRQMWPLLPEGGASRAVVEVAERYAMGEATDDELVAARVAASAAASAAWDASAAARDSARAAAWDAARDAWAAARAAQADHLREVVPVATVEALYAASLEATR